MWKKHQYIIAKLIEVYNLSVVMFNRPNIASRLNYIILPPFEGNPGAEIVFPSCFPSFGAAAVRRNWTDCKSFMLIAMDAKGLEFLSSLPFLSSLFSVGSPLEACALSL